MRNFFITVVLTAASVAATAQIQYIPWKADYMLTWTDFEDTPTPGSEFYAETFWKFNYRSSSDKDGLINVSLSCSFDKGKSWKRTDKELTPKLLLHEQLHFYIAEIFARKMRKAFKEYAATHKYSANSNAEIKAIFERIDKECRSYQDQYDTETNHSKNEEAQQSWRKKIVTELKDLDAFSS